MSVTFDSFADTYEEACQRGLALTGESRSYYAKQRVRISADLVRPRMAHISRILDFGCGVGHTEPVLQSAFPSASIVGLDNSWDSIERAKQNYGGDNVRFVTALQSVDYGSFDLAYCNGVFHHISPNEREQHTTLILDALRPGGLFAYWENNPWNPGTRLVMRRIPFDRDAVLLSPFESRRLLATNGFRVLHTGFHFYFPSVLRVLRPLEPALAWLPLGGQYCVLSMKR